MSDQELADKIVALGVGWIQHHPNLPSTQVYRLGTYWDSADGFVRDWRVAGALSERVDGVEYARLTDGRWQCLICPPNGTFMKDSFAENESLPRAISEACVEALDEN